jgi:hypothetical protein
MEYWSEFVLATQPTDDAFLLGGGCSVIVQKGTQVRGDNIMRIIKVKRIIT